MFSPQEKFLVIEIGTDGSRGFLVELSRDRILKLRKQWHNFDFMNLLGRGNKFGKSAKIIFSLDFPVAFEAAVDVAVQRENPERLLEESELENIFVEAVQKNFNICREKAAKAMSVPESNVDLISVRVNNLKFNRAIVLGTYSQKPKRIEACLEMIFAGRNMLQTMNHFPQHLPDAFFFENVAAQIFSLRKVRGLESVNFLSSSGAEYCLFTPRVESGCVSFGRHKISWPANWPHQVLSAIWKLDVFTSGKAYREYLARNVSAGLQKRLDGIFKPFVNNFSLRLKSCVPKGRFYIGEAVPPPFSGKGLQFESAANVLPSLLQKVGFVLDRRWPLGSQETMRLIGPILKSHQDGSHALNKKIWRRLHWLNFSNMR